MVAISRAPYARIEPFQRRMGWRFKWLSSFENDFNFDFHASFKPEEITRGNAFFNYSWTNPGPPEREGLSVFRKDEGGALFHTYSTYARGIDLLNGTYNLLDLVPRGRDEDGLKSPQAWVQYHDRYEG